MYIHRLTFLSVANSKNEAYVRKNPSAMHQFYLTQITSLATFTKCL